MLTPSTARQLAWHPVYEVPSFLAGQLLVCRGSKTDYESLERFHYRPKRPATFAEVWVVRHIPPGDPAAAGTVAVAVLSYPTLSHREREVTLNLVRLSEADRARFVNRHIRTISRVAVHPTFRSLGLAAILVRCILHHGPTRYIEAMAVMGRAHPFFERAGMTLISTPPASSEDRPLYYLYDRRNARSCLWRYPVCDYLIAVRR